MDNRILSWNQHHSRVVSYIHNLLPIIDQYIVLTYRVWTRWHHSGNISNLICASFATSRIPSSTLLYLYLPRHNYIIVLWCLIQWSLISMILTFLGGIWIQQYNMSNVRRIVPQIWMNLETPDSQWEHLSIQTMQGS